MKEIKMKRNIGPGLLFELHIKMCQNTQFIDKNCLKRPLLCVIFV